MISLEIVGVSRRTRRGVFLENKPSSPVSIKMISKSSVAILILLPLFTGCGRISPQDGTVREFGRFDSPDKSKMLEVTRRERSIVDFRVLEVSSGEIRASGTIGSDAMRWLLFWETPNILWAYGSDTGYFMRFEFRADGTTEELDVDATVPIPQAIWDNLPSVLQGQYRGKGNSP
jgi:hypothetical protein